MIKNDFNDNTKTTYTGKPIDLVKDAYDGLKYVKNRDFTIEYEPQNINAGKVLVKINGIGNYKDAKEEFEFTIAKRQISDKNVKVAVQGLTYSSDLTDSQIKNAISITYNGMTLVENTDYKITGITKNGKNITLTIAGMDTFDFADSRSDGKMIVVDKDGKVVPTSQYTVSYKDNTAAGTATITVEGKSGYTLYAVNTFKIVPAKLSKQNIVRFDVEAKDYYYTGDAIEPSVDVTIEDSTYKLVKDVDYKLTYSDNVNAGTNAKVTLVGLGNYAGVEAEATVSSTLTKEFTIQKTAIRPTDIVAKDVAYAGGLPVTPNVIITNRYSGKTLVEGTDYTVEIKEGGTSVGQVKALVKLTEAAQKNYVITPAAQNPATEYAIIFNVIAQDLANVSINAIADQSATGEQIKPAIVVMNGKARLVEGYDYEVSYGENKEVGEGTVTIKALASNKNYTGSQTAKFNIVKEFPVGTPVLKDVVVAGNKATAVLSGTAEDAEGYDFVVATADDYVTGRVAINKNRIETEADFYYLAPGTYYAYCHAWKRDEDGRKVFGDWSNRFEFTVEAVTPETPVITGVKVSGSTVTVTYTECEDAEGYDVVLGTTTGKAASGEKRPYDYGTLVKKVKSGTTVTATFKNVEAGTYYAGLHAWNRTSADGKKVFSKWSNIKTVKVK